MECVFVIIVHYELLCVSVIVLMSIVLKLVMKRKCTAFEVDIFVLSLFVSIFYMSILQTFC